MPEVQTRHFGVISCHDDAILLFPEGLPAFETARRFIAIERPATAPAVFLQCIEDVELCFVLLPVLAVDPGYSLELSLEDLNLLELDARSQPVIGGQIACFAVVSVPENGPATANLLAPIVINLETRVAVQAIRTDRAYSHQHPLILQGVSC